VRALIWALVLKKNYNPSKKILLSCQTYCILSPSFSQISTFHKNMSVQKILGRAKPPPPPHLEFRNIHIWGLSNGILRILFYTQISLGGLENVLWWCKNSWRCTSLPPVSLFFHDTSFSKARKLMILYLLNFGKSYKHLPNNYATWYAINSLARADYTGPYCMAKYIFFVEECYQVSYRFIKIFRTLSMSTTFQVLASYLVNKLPWCKNVTLTNKIFHEK
jgi:hypothetical protein